jgi:hypothetical protein
MGILKRLGVALCMVAVLTQSSSVLANDSWWWWSHASAYGSESVHDGGHWNAEHGKYEGYYGHMTSWGWNCATPEMRKPDSPHYKWAVMPDGSYGQWQILPVIDAGPYGAGTPSVDNSPGWNWDIMEPVVLRVGWDRVSQSRYHWDDNLELYGRRDVMVRYRPDLGRFCPNWGYHDKPAVG